MSWAACLNLQGVGPNGGQLVASSVPVQRRFMHPDVNGLLDPPLEPSILHTQNPRFLQTDVVVWAIGVNVA